LTARRTAFVTGAADVLTAFGHLDVLVNNAGVPLTCPAVEVPRRSGTRSSTST